MSLKRYITTVSFLEMTYLHAKIKTTNKGIEKMFVAESGYASHMVNSLKYITNLR